MRRGPAWRDRADREEDRSDAPHPKWARLDEEGDGGLRPGPEFDLLRSTGGTAAPEPLSMGLKAFRVHDLNRGHTCEAGVCAARFHPSGEMAAVVGPDRRLSLYKVLEDEGGELLDSVHLAQCPLHNCAFLTGGSQLICTGKRPFFYVLNVNEGKLQRVNGFGQGETNLSRFCVGPDGKTLVFLSSTGSMWVVSAHTFQCTGSLKMNGQARSAVFAEDGMLFSCAGSRVYAWDLRTESCVNVVSTNVLQATSLVARGATVGLGCTSGVVSLYDRESCLTMERPRVVRDLDNLVTSIDSMAISPDARLLAFASCKKRTSVRVARIPVVSICPDFPARKDRVGKVTCLEFSPDGSLLCMGNTVGRAMLYRLPQTKR